VKRTTSCSVLLDLYLNLVRHCKWCYVNHSS
jgi:hypothetical protein